MSPVRRHASALGTRVAALGGALKSGSGAASVRRSAMGEAGPFASGERGPSTPRDRQASPSLEHPHFWGWTTWTHRALKTPVFGDAEVDATARYTPGPSLSVPRSKEHPGDPPDRLAAPPLPRG